MPQSAHVRNAYQLRNRNDMTLYRARTQLFYKSYFPATTRDWNALPLEIRFAPSLNVFNSLLRLHIPTPPRRAWFGCGDRQLDIYHSRMRMGCSALKSHLHFNLHVENDPNCACGREIEHASHYFLRCERHDEPRVALLSDISNFIIPTIDVILHGDESLPLESNVQIALIVQGFIRASQRFSRPNQAV